MGCGLVEEDDGSLYSVSYWNYESELDELSRFRPVSCTVLTKKKNLAPQKNFIYIPLYQCRNHPFIPVVANLQPQHFIIGCNFLFFLCVGWFLWGDWEDVFERIELLVALACVDIVLVLGIVWLCGNGLARGGLVDELMVVN